MFCAVRSTQDARSHVAAIVWARRVGPEIHPGLIKMSVAECTGQPQSATARNQSVAPATRARQNRPARRRQGGSVGRAGAASGVTSSADKSPFNSASLGGLAIRRPASAPSPGRTSHVPLGDFGILAKVDSVGTTHRGGIAMYRVSRQGERIEDVGMIEGARKIVRAPRLPRRRPPCQFRPHLCVVSCPAACDTRVSEEVCYSSRRR
jgi:hypothetical protein